MDYFGARYFSGAQGRFLSPDPENASASLFDPQSWNAYSYTLNNPHKYIDPDGEVPILVVTSLIGAGVGGIGGAGVSFFGQWMDKGFRAIDYGAVGTSAAGGFVQGGLAGLTLGGLGITGLVGSGVVNGVTNMVGGAVTRELNEQLDIPNNLSGDEAAVVDFVSGAVGGGAGAKAANVRYPLPNIRKQISVLSRYNKLSIQRRKIAAAIRYADQQNIRNTVVNSTAGTSVMNAFSEGISKMFDWMDLYFGSLREKVQVKVCYPDGNGGMTCP